MDIRIKKLVDLYVHFKVRTFEFDRLFSDEERIVHLRDSLLPDFFQDLAELYWEHMFMTIAKLLDPYQQHKNTNLSLFALEAVLIEQDSPKAPELHSRLLHFRRKFETITYYRKKNLAHFDKDYSTGNREFDTSTHFDEVVDFLDEMIDLINFTLHALELPAESGLVMYPAHHAGARQLLEILEIEAQRREKEEV